MVSKSEAADIQTIKKKKQWKQMQKSGNVMK